MFKINRRRGVVLGVIASLAIGGAAFAYWTAGGSGTGSGSAAGSQTGLTANQTTTLTAMYPGDSAQTISGAGTFLVASERIVRRPSGLAILYPHGSTHNTGAPDPVVGAWVGFRYDRGGEACAS